MTLKEVVNGHIARPFGAKDHVADSMVVTVSKAKEPKSGESGDRKWFSTMLTVSDGSGQDAIVFVNGEHRPAIGSQVTLEGVKFYSFERKAKERGGGEWLNLGLTATGLTGSAGSATQSQSGSQAPATNNDSKGYGYDDPPEKRTSIEAQACMHDAVQFGLLRYEKNGHDLDDAEAVMEKAMATLWVLLQKTKSAVLPAQPAQSANTSQPAAGQPAKPEGPGTFAEAATAGAMLVKIMDGDQAKARQAFTALTGAKTLSECPDQGCATGWLTIVTNLKRSFEKLAKPDEQALFRETLVEPGLTPDERDAKLEDIVVGSALPF
jgi:hypothetical protein